MYTSREKRFRAKVIGGEITRKTDALVILKKKFPKNAEGLYYQINIKRYGRVSALKCARNRPCIYTRAGELRAPEIIRSQ